MFDAEDLLTGQWLVHFERDTALFNAFFNPQVPDGSCILQVGSSVYIVLWKSGLLSKYMHFNDFGNVPDHCPCPGCFDNDSRR